MLKMFSQKSKNAKRIHNTHDYDVKYSKHIPTYYAVGSVYSCNIILNIKSNLLLQL